MRKDLGLELAYGDLEAIRKNRAKIGAERKRLNAELKILDGLSLANQSLCEHPNKTSYYDPRDSGWDCPDCGAAH